MMAAYGLRVPARNALPSQHRPARRLWPRLRVRAGHGQLRAIAGPLLALGLVSLVGTRTAIALSIIPGLLAALAIIYAIRHAPRADHRQQQPLRLRIPRC